MSNELKPCPFCGGKARLIKGDVCWVKCDYCGAETAAETSTTEAIAAYNRRANADGWNSAIDIINDAPTVDAVPIRCKDCKYCYAEGFVNVRNVCEKHYDFGNVDDDWFCADGERRSE